MPKNVIVGGGAAGINAIETIRQFDSSSPITLICNEPVYMRAALPRFLAKEIAESDLHKGSDKYFTRLKVTRRKGCVVRIAAKAKRVELEGGESIPYDNLLIATGSSPQRPPIAGASGKHVHTLWTLADAHALLESASMKRPSVVLVGAGFTGMVILHALHKLGWKLSVVDKDAHILPRVLDQRGAQAVEAWLRDRGVELYAGVSVTSIAGGRTKTIALSDGRQLTSHAVILSTGVNPNTGFLKGSGIKVDKGIIVDDHMRTNVAGVYAAGDVAQGPDLLGGPSAIHPVQTTAIDHGGIAGANMAGQKRAYAGSLMVSTLEVADLYCASIGRWSEDADATTLWDAGVYRKLVWDSDRLIGGIILGPAADTTLRADADALKTLIESRVGLGARKAQLQDKPCDLRRVHVTGDATSKPSTTTRERVGATATA